MSATPKSEKNVSGGDGGSGGGSGGKGGGGRLARRARSFKEDFLEILAGMRSPGGGSAAANAHNSTSASTTGTGDAGGGGGAGAGGGAVGGDSLRELEGLLKQVRFALRHFGDVVNKNTLEMLPGNGTVVLETVAGIHSLLKNFALDGQSSAVASATNQVYQSVARLIKVCDDVLIHGEAALNKEEAMEVCSLVGNAVQNLVSLVRDKMTAPRPESVSASPRVLGEDIPGLEVTQPYNPSEKRNGSLPEIPLSPRERLILEQTSRRSGRGGSSDGDSPPPKPPLPSRFLGKEFALEASNASSSSPPPLPPKRRPRTQDDRRSPIAPGDEEAATLECSALDTTGDGSGASLRSRSPDTSSLLSAGSLDSVPNQAEENLPVNAPLPPGAPVGILVRTPSPQERSLEASPSRRVIGTEGEEVPEDDEEDRRSESGFASLRSSGQSYGLGSVSRGSQQSFGEPTNATTPPPLSPPHPTTCRVISQHRQVQRRVVSSTVTTMTSTRRVISDPVSGTTESDVLSTTSSSSSSSSCTFARHMLRSGGASPAGVSDAPTPPPPALPEKRVVVPGRLPRVPSQYDNVPEGGLILPPTNPSESFTEVDGEDAEDKVVYRVKESSDPTISSTTDEGDDDLDKKPPPLPPKNRQIMKYMEMFGNCTQLTGSEYQRHSVELYTLVQREWQQAQRELASHPASMISSASQFLAFQRIHTPQSIAISSSRSLSLFSSSTIHSPSLPSSPPHNHLTFSIEPKEDVIQPSSQISADNSRPTSPPLPPADFNASADFIPMDSPPALPPKRRSIREGTSGSKISPPSPTLTPCSRLSASSPRPPEESVALVAAEEGISPRRVEVEEDDDEVSPLEELDVSKYLSFKRPEEDGPEIRGGHIDALVVQATKANKNDFMYQEAFLTTYRTFLSPAALVEKLCFRHQHFSSSPDHAKQRAARNALSLLVRVVGDLTVSDLDDSLLNTLVDYEQQLVCSGDLTMARIFRLKLLERCEAKRLHEAPHILLPSLNVYTRQSSLLDFKSERVAEQMTLLDASLFARIEIPEVLIWAKEQNEERSPNLTRFTEHFNKMSYWARSRILQQSDAKERERHVAKFTKVMRHLRRLNNFNSYLALLSALDSAPIRRLEWQQRHVADTLKEYCALIDSSCSFRAYRQALAETNPPCIPYIGLVLQDLTFVHIGNSDLLADGSINFSKRWQQFNIVENMKKFKKCQYNFKKNERIIAFFNNFDEFLCEEAMWQISESIRPRGGKKPPGLGD